MSRRALRGFDPSRLTDARQNRGLSRSDLGRLAGIAYNTIRRWETGAATPTTEALQPIARVLDVDIDDLTATEPSERTLRSWRTLTRLTQSEAADAVGLSASTYSRIERGERPVTAAETQELAVLFGATPNQIRQGWARAHDRQPPATPSSVDPR